MKNPVSFAEPLEKKGSALPSKDRIILFVCTGNTCRSPMCEALFNAFFKEATSLRADSCGLAAYGEPISENAVQALIERGIKSEGDNNYISHRSKPVTEELMEQAEMVVGMTNRHAMELMFRYPVYASKIHVIPRDISDPYGGDLVLYKKCLTDIEAALKEAFPANRENEHE